jgi:hypothetical protein
LAEESRIGVDLVLGLKQLMQDRYADDWRAALIKEENARLRPSSAPPMSQSESLSALSRLAEFEKSSMANVASSKVQPATCVADSTELRRQIIDYLAGEGLVTAWVRLTSRIAGAQKMS